MRAASARDHVVAMSLRYLLPRAIRLAVTPSSCCEGKVAGFCPRRVPGLALKVLVAVAGCRLVWILDKAADVDTMRMIQHLEDEERTRYANSSRGHWQTTVVAQATAAIIFGVGYGTSA